MYCICFSTWTYSTVHTLLYRCCIVLDQIIDISSLSLSLSLSPTHTHTHIHIHTYTYTYTHRPTHTHTHTHICISLLLCLSYLDREARVCVAVPHFSMLVLTADIVNSWYSRGTAESLCLLNKDDTYHNYTLLHSENTLIDI